MITRPNDKEKVDRYWNRLDRVRNELTRTVDSMTITLDGIIDLDEERRLRRLLNRALRAANTLGGHDGSDEAAVKA